MNPNHLLPSFCTAYKTLAQDKYVITVRGISSPLLGVSIVHLVGRSDWFKISNLVYGGRKIVWSLYSSVQGQTVYGGYSELASRFIVCQCQN